MKIKDKVRILVDKPWYKGVTARVQEIDCAVTVEFGDGTRELFDPSELEVIIRKTKTTTGATI